MRLGALFALLLLDTLTSPDPRAAHPFHVSLAEVEFNAESGKLEVALRVYPLDLEKALTLHAARRISIDDEPEVDALIAAYLKDRFRVTGADGKPASIEWVGRELSVKDAWLYFEMPLSGGIHDASRLEVTA